MLVIRPFITLPARHSAVWVNAISPDSHNYPKIERGREISLAMALWVRESLGKYTEEEGKATSVLFQPDLEVVCARLFACVMFIPYSRSINLHPASHTVKSSVMDPL